MWDEPGACYTEWSKSEREKQILYTSMGSRKMVLRNLFAKQEYKCRYREWTCGHRGEGEGGMNGKRSMETCIAMRKIDSQWDLL